MSFTTFIEQYERAIIWIVAHCPAPDKFAHTYAGLTIWLLTALIFRLPLRSWFPVIVVLAFEVGNECIDRVAHGSWMWVDTLKDVAATLFWPTILTIALRTAVHLRR